jgi:hypothetical protein
MAWLHQIPNQQADQEVNMVFCSHLSTSRGKSVRFHSDSTPIFFGVESESDSTQIFFGVESDRGVLP